MMAESKRMMACWAMGLTQHRDAVLTIRTLVNMLLLGGHIGRPGAGTCCVRGHSNVQGDRTMGVWERPTGPFLDAMEKEFHFPMPREAGHDVVDSIAAMHDREIDVFIGLGGNFLAASPDTVCTAEALRKLRPHGATSPPSSIAVIWSPGRESMILPCLGRSEKDPRRLRHRGGLDGRGERVPRAAGSRRRRSSGARWPSSPASRAATLGSTSKIDWMGSRATTIASAITSAASCPASPTSTRGSRAGPFLPAEPARATATSSPRTGKAHFAVAPDLRPRPRRPTGTSCMTHPEPRPVQHHHLRLERSLPRRPWRPPRRVHESRRHRGPRVGSRTSASTSPVTSAARSAWPAASSWCRISIPRRCLAAYFPEANVLVPLGSVAEWSNTPTSKSIHVTLERSS